MLRSGLRSAPRRSRAVEQPGRSLGAKRLSRGGHGSDDRAPRSASRPCRYTTGPHIPRAILPPPMSAAISGSSRETSPYPLAEALRRERPPERTHRTVHPCDSAWAASFFLCRLLSAAPAPRRVDRERAQSILAEQGCPDFLANAERRNWIRFVLDVAKIPGAVSSAFQTGRLRGDLEALSAPEKQALLALIDATDHRHEFRLTRARATELGDLHAQAHPETPTMEALILA